MKHWILVIMSCGLAITAIGLPVLATGVFITPIANELGVYRGNVSMHNTLTMLSKATMSLYASVLLSKYSIKKVLITGIFLGSISNFLIGLTSSIWIFNLLGLLRGFGTGMIAWVPITILLNEWFEEKHGIVMSIVLSFSTLSGAIFTPIFTRFNELYGWAVSYQIMGVFMLIFALPVLFIPFTLKPKDSGYLPYGSDQNSRDKNSEEKTVKNKEEQSISTSIFILLFVFILLQTLLIGATQHFPGFAETIGLTSEVGATMMSLAMISSIFFKIGMGYISDRIGPVMSTIIVLASVAVGSFMLLTLTQMNLLYIAAILYGGIFSIPSVSITLLTKEFFGRYHFARLYPIFAFSTSLGGAVSLSLIGYIFDFTGSYLPAFMIALGINLLNIALLLIMSWRSKRYA